MECDRCSYAWSEKKVRLNLPFLKRREITKNLVDSLDTDQIENLLNIPYFKIWNTVWEMIDTAIQNISENIPAFEENGYELIDWNFRLRVTEDKRNSLRFSLDFIKFQAGLDFILTHSEFITESESV